MESTSNTTTNNSSNTNAFKRICRLARRTMARLEDEVNSSESPNMVEIGLLKSRMVENKENFEKAQTQLELLCEDGELEATWEQREEFDELYNRTMVFLLNKTISNTSVGLTANTNNNSNNVPVSVRLPKLTIPKFNGSYTDWVSFSDVFKTLVHDCEMLSNTQKLQYLKGCLVGEPANLISTLQVAERNYMVAWELLVERYENKRLIINTHIKELFNMTKINRESPTALRNLTDSFMNNIRALEALEQPVESWDSIIIYMICSKLDTETYKRWESSLSQDKLPTIPELVSFLQNRCRVLESLSFSTEKVSKSFTTTVKSNNCELCLGDHALYMCSKFRSKTPQERFKIVKNKSLCLICLKSNHRVIDCKSGAKYKCRCGKNHNYLLHFVSQSDNTSDNNAPSSSVQPTANPSSDSADDSATRHSFSCTNIESKRFIVLPTALVKFRCGNITGKLRILLDSCSQVTIVRDSAVKRFKLPVQESSMLSFVKGVGSNKFSANKAVDLQLHSFVNRFVLNITADIVPANTFEYSSNLSMDSDSLAKLRNFRLADPNYNKIADVDLILGAEYFEQIMLPKTNRVDNLFLRETQFGWTISGPVIEKSTTNKFCGFTSQEVEVQFEKFWNLEDIPEASSDDSVDSLTKFEKCVDLFHKNLSVASDGRFVVKLPFRINPDLQIALEGRKTKVVSLMPVKTFNILEYYSSYLKLIKAICYLIRFCNFRFLKMTLDTGQINCIEFQTSLLVATRIHQKQHFNPEIGRLISNQRIKCKSIVSTLNPYLDNNTLLRVCGRLDNSTLSDDRKHPIILYGKSNFVKSLIRYLHQRYFHANIDFVANLVSEHYWIVDGRKKVIKSVIRTCLVCQKSKAELGKQLMGTLPTARITPSRPFTESGVDFAGQFECKCVNHRSTKFFKIYLAVLICLQTRAVHLEVVSCLSTEAFISTLHRFISRRGRPSSMFSDNGTNFVGTANILKFQRNLVEFGTKENIKWTFSPPQSPHHGGMWEAAVKTTKVFLVRLMRNQALNYEEYNTLFTRIEAIMNSRPLCYRMSNDQGTEIITPGHFLVGSSLLENASLEEDYIATTRRLQLLHNLINGFWKVWNVDYLHQLQQRYKWNKVRPNLEIGMLVLVREPGSKPFQWPLGKIMQVYPDKQGLVRIFDVLVRGKVKRRSVTTVVPLQLAD